MSKQLWADERIEDYANATYDASFYFEVVESMKLVRDDLQARIATLEARNAQTQARIDAALTWLDATQEVQRG